MRRRKMADLWVLPTSVTLVNIGERSSEDFFDFWADQNPEMRGGGGGVQLGSSESSHISLTQTPVTTGRSFANGLSVTALSCHKLPTFWVSFGFNGFECETTGSTAEIA